MGPPLPPRLKSAAVHAGMVATSGVAWVILWMFNKHLTSAVQVTSGISLVYLPAGFRLLIILVFGGWGALGIFLFEPLLFFNEFEAGSAAEVFATSAISGFSPWLVTVLFCRAAGNFSIAVGIEAGSPADACAGTVAGDAAHLQRLLCRGRTPSRCGFHA